MESSHGGCAPRSFPEDFVKALSETVGDLSREIANTLQTFEQERKI
jgi:hypothetical protein